MTTTNNQNPVKKKGLIRKFLRIILYIILALISLNILLYIALSIPFVQQKVLSYAVEKVQNITKSEISIEKVRLRLFNHVSLQGVYLADLNKDTLLYVNDLSVSISPLDLLKSKLQINAIDISNFTVKISQKTPDSDFNYQFLIDAFAGDTINKDTTTSDFKIAIENVKLNKGRFVYDILSDTITPKLFNASHIQINNLNAEVLLPSIDSDKLDIVLKKLAFNESSGLNVKNLIAKLTSENNNFKITDLILELAQSSLVINEANYNIDTDEFRILSQMSSLSPKDIIPFMHELKFLNNDITFQASLSGKLPQISLDSIHLNYGKDATLTGSAFISDYNKLDTTNLKVDIPNIKINSDAITDFSKLGDSTFIAPDIMTTMGDIFLTANLSGKLSDLNLKAETWMNHGAIQMTAKGSIDTTFTNFDIKSKFQTQNLNLGKLLEIPELGRLSLNIDFDAHQTPKESLAANLKGEIEQIQYDKENYRNIPFTAYYNAKEMGAWIKADVSIGKVESTVKIIQEKRPKTSIDLFVNNLLINKFIELEDWNNPRLSFDLSGEIIGSEMNDIEGTLIMNNLSFSHDSIFFNTDRLSLDVRRDSYNKNIFIQLMSKFASISIMGKCNLMNISDEFDNLMHTYLPSIFKKHRINRLEGNNNFKFNVFIDNTSQIEQILDLPFSLKEPVKIEGLFDAKNNFFSVMGNVPLLHYGDNIITNTTLNLANNDSALNIDLNSLAHQDKDLFALTLKTKIASDTLDTYLNLRSDSVNLKLDATLEALATFSKNRANEIESHVLFKPSSINIGNLALDFLPASIFNNATQTKIANLGLNLRKDKEISKILSIDGTISKNKQDTLNVNFANIQIADILTAFNIDNIKTNINGDIKIVNVLDLPEVYTKDFRLNDIVVFGDTLGNMRTYSKWDSAKKGIGFYASLGKGEPLSIAKGWAFPDKDSLNVDVNLNKFSLDWLSPFTEGILNRLSGSISTGLKVGGKMSAPKVNGWLGINDTYFGIDYTNVTYFINDTINISSDKIGFENLIITDSYKNIAKVNATITHQNFKNLEYNVDMKLNNLLILNTENRTDSLFYGKVFTNGNVNIKGDADLMKINLDIKNGKKSKINILIPQTSEAIDYAGIVYINTPESETDYINDKEPESVFPMIISGNVNINNDLILDVIIDPETGDKMEIVGSGLTKFNYDSRSEIINTFGNYIISSGYVSINLQDISTMKFQIENGSKVVMNGDPLNSTFNINAYKRVRADLRTLDASFGSSGGNTKVPVDCILGISGDMNKMNLTYNIKLPDAPDDIQQKFKSLLTTDEQKTRQFAYLVLTGSFSSSGSNGGSGGGSMADGVVTSLASKALSTGLNSLFGNVLGDKWQVGTNISSNDGTFSDMDMSVSVSRSFMDDKLTFNTNLGYRTDQTLDAENSFIGDFEVGYALSNSVKLRAFNQTNNQFYKQSPITQGVGIVYTKEAKKLKDLFRIFRKKNKNKNIAESGAKE